MPSSQPWFDHSPSCTRLAFPFLSLAAGSLPAISNPQLTSWMTAQSSKYARVTETTTTTPVATWPSPGIPKNANSPSQTLPAYVWIRCATGA